MIAVTAVQQPLIPIYWAKKEGKVTILLHRDLTSSQIWTEPTKEYASKFGNEEAKVKYLG